MADKNKPQDDLSIEEILGSIRRIIADDEEEPGKETVQHDSDIVEDDEEPLALTNKIEADGSIAPTVREETPEETAETLDEPPPPAAKPQEQDTEEKIILKDSETMAQQDDDDYLSDDDALLSTTTASAAGAVMAKLARQAAINEEGKGGVTLEAMTREMLKPMLRQWLDAHLPDLVRTMVEREIEKLTKRL